MGTYKILEEAARDVTRWIANWTSLNNGGTFSFSFVSSMFRDLRTWMELLLEDVRIASLKLDQVFSVWGLGWSTNAILKASMEWSSSSTSPSPPCWSQSSASSKPATPKTL